MRRKPRVSLMKLAEYLRASATRRRAIVRSQAEPRDVVVSQYRRAEASIVRFLRSEARDVRSLERSVERIRSTVPKTEWEERDLANSSAAVEAFLELLPQLKLGDRTLQLSRRRPVLQLGGVDVSVTPAAVVLDHDGKKVGALKFAFAKSRPVPPDEGQDAAIILRTYLEARAQGSEATVEPDLCQIVDLLDRQVYVAPGPFKRRMREVEMACMEIANVWPGRGPSDQPPVYAVA